MSSVQLIVTGKMEEKCLSVALKRAFPHISFPPPQYVDGFTSADVSKTPLFKPSGPFRNIDKIAGALVAAVDPGRCGTPADMAIAVDDLELENLHQPDIVAEYFRQAVIECVKSRWTSQERQKTCFRKVRENCSFHLFVPMTEAYFFGETDALKRAGAERSSMVSGMNMDVEDFRVTNDSDYLKAVKGDFYWAIDTNKRDRHPKHYLQYLCDPECKAEKNERYRETKGGVEALKKLNWNSVLKNSQYVKFLRSLFDDISDRFGFENPYRG